MTDRRDAQTLARPALTGEPTAIRVPTPGKEALRSRCMLVALSWRNVITVRVSSDQCLSPTTRRVRHYDVRVFVTIQNSLSPAPKPP